MTLPTTVPSWKLKLIEWSIYVGELTRGHFGCLLGGVLDVLELFIIKEQNYVVQTPTKQYIVTYCLFS